MIAATCYTLRSGLTDFDTARETLRRVREAGYDTVQVSGFTQLDGGQVAALLKETGLNCCGAHIAFERLRDQLDDAVADLRSWGSPEVSVPAMPADVRSGTGEEVPRFARELNALGARLRDAGIGLTYHNHSFELRHWDGRTWLETLYAETDPDLVRAEIDTYWIQHGGADPVAWIERLSGRLPLLHVKDMGIVEPMNQVDLPVGDGNLDWDRILPAAQAAGVKWYIVEQDNPEGDPVDCVARSYRFLKANLPA